MAQVSRDTRVPLELAQERGTAYQVPGVPGVPYVPGEPGYIVRANTGTSLLMLWLKYSQHYWVCIKTKLLNCTSATSSFGTDRGGESGNTQN